MKVSFGRRYEGLAQGLDCACHSPIALNLFKSVSKGLSRRSVLRGIAATLAAPALGLAMPSFAQTASKPVLLRNLRIFDGNASQLIEGKSVLVDGNSIKALPGAGETVTDADVIDCAGRTLMPGLIDAHWHMLLASISQLVALTMRGFTTVRAATEPASRWAVSP